MTNFDYATLNAILRYDFGAFVEKTFQIVSPSDVFIPNWHIDLMTDALAQCYYGKTKRLIIAVPPRCLKSICASIAFPAWALGLDPTLRIICASYGQELSNKLANGTRSVMLNPFYHDLFPMTRLVRTAEYDLQTTRKGMRYATSVGGPVTGLGGDIIIIDDPMKPDESLSQPRRDAVKNWHDGVLHSRLNNKVEGVIIVVMQRLHVDDFVAHVMDKEDWVLIELPAMTESHTIYTLSDGRQFERHPGDILCPQFGSLEDLEKIENRIGTFNYSAQYLQQPIPEEGSLVKWPWFPVYDMPPPFTGNDEIVQSWDTAMTESELSDYSACLTVHVKDNQYYLLDMFRQKLGYPALRQALIDQAKRFKAKVVLVEESAFGNALIQEIRSNNPGIPNPIGMKPKDSKVMRMSCQSAKIQAGHVHLPKKAPWLSKFKKEILAFPHGAHDDQVDALSQFLTWIDERSSRTIRMMKLTGF